MSGPGRFGSVLCAMVTPFDPDGQVDLKGAGRLAKHLVSNGNEGLVITGTTGESPTLKDAEKIALWRQVRFSFDGPFVAGTSTSDTEHSVNLTAEAVNVGADAILAVTPYYSRPSQEGIKHHMRLVAKAARGRPVLLYDIPSRTGRQLSVETMLELAAEGTVAGVKDATGKIARAAELIAAAEVAGYEFEVYSGNDADTLPLLAVGARGVISVESHWAGHELAELCRLYFEGKVDEARAMNARLLASHRFQSSDEAPNPVPTKAMLRVMGLDAGGLRPPMGPEPAGLAEAAALVLRDLGRHSQE